MLVGGAGRLAVLSVGAAGRLGMLRVGGAGQLAVLSVGAAGRLGVLRVGGAGRLGNLSVCGARQPVLLQLVQEKAYIWNDSYHPTYKQRDHGREDMGKEKDSI